MDLGYANLAKREEEAALAEQRGDKAFGDDGIKLKDAREFKKKEDEEKEKKQRECGTCCT